MSAPYIPFFIGDYMRDTQHLSTEQHGAYILLIFTMWNHNGVLPNNDKKLARITRMTAAKWQNNKDDILAFFEIDGDKISHGKISELLKKYEKKSTENAENGRKGGLAKSLKNKGLGLANATKTPERTLKQPEPEPNIIDRLGVNSNIVARAPPPPPNDDFKGLDDDSEPDKPEPRQPTQSTISTNQISNGANHDKRNNRNTATTTDFGHWQPNQGTRRNAQPFDQFARGDGNDGGGGVENGGADNPPNNGGLAGGYGRCWRTGRALTMHDLAYAFINGDIPH